MLQEKSLELIIIERPNVITDNTIAEFILHADKGIGIVPWTDKTTSAIVARLQSSCSLGHTFVAMKGDHLIGVTHFTLIRREWDDVPIVQIDLLAVEGSKDRFQIADQLLLEIEKNFDNIKSLTVYVDNTNWSLLSFWNGRDFIFIDSKTAPESEQTLFLLERVIPPRKIIAEVPVAVMVFNVPQYLSVLPLVNGLEEKNIKVHWVVPYVDSTTAESDEGYGKIILDVKNHIEKNGYKCLDTKLLSNTFYRIVMAPYADDFLAHGSYTINYFYSYIVKADWSYQIHNLLSFDCVLCHGDQEKEVRQFYSNTCIVGEPRALGFHRKERKENDSISVLYAPTYAQGIDVNKVCAALKALPSKYHVIIKLHPGTSSLSAEQNILNTFQQNFGSLYSGNDDLFQLMSNADILLSDYSGAIYNALSVGLPVALLRIDENKNFIPAPMLEQLVEHKILPCSTSSETLEQALETALHPKVSAAQQTAMMRICSVSPERGLINFTTLIQDVLTGKQPKNAIAAGAYLHSGYRHLTSSLGEKNNQAEAMSLAMQRVCYLKQTSVCEVLSLKKTVEKLSQDLQQMTDNCRQLHNAVELSKGKNQQLSVECDQLRKTSKQSADDVRRLLFEREEIREALRRLSKESILLSSLHSMKLAHWVAKTQNHFIKGTTHERKEYIKWLFTPSCKHQYDHNPATNPLVRLTAPIQVLSSKLERAYSSTPTETLCNVLEDAISHYNGNTIIFLPELADWNIPLFQRPQQLAKAFATLGVMYIYTTPNELDTISAPQILQNNCILIRSVDTATVVHLVKKYQKKVIIDICSTDNIHFAEWFKQWEDCNYSVLYEYIDEISEHITGKVPLETLNRHKKFLADPRVFVVATAEKLFQEVIALRGNDTNCLVSGNGVDCEHFQQASNLSLIPQHIQRIIARNRPVIGYFGAIANWFDFELIIYAAKQRPNYDFLLIGPLYGNHDLPLMKKLRRMHNVHITGTINYQTLPQVAMHFTAATIPFLLNDITESTSPIKLFEYMALGKPIVTTAMRECYKHSVHIAHTKEQYVQLLDVGVKESNDPVLVQHLLAEANKNSWLEKAKELINLLRIEQGNLEEKQ